MTNMRNHSPFNALEKRADEFPSMGSLSASSPQVLCVVLPKSKFTHYGLAKDFHTVSDKRKVAALCGKDPVGDTWQFRRAGRTCAACHAEAARTRAIVVSPPILSKPVFARGNVGSPGSPASSDDGGILLSSKYEGTCSLCKEPYDTGARVYWKRGAGCRHEACGPHGSAPKKPGPVPTYLDRQDAATNALEEETP